MRVTKVLPALAIVTSFAALALPTGCSASSGNATFGDSTDAGNADVVDDQQSISFADATQEGSISDGGGVLNDARPDVDAQSCSPDAGGPGPVQRVCVHYGSDDNECDGHHDLSGFPANSTGGNGFDDNCNGLVDEGCSCTGIGTTKDCYMVPASQTSLGKPVGWCAQNSKGTVDCVKFSAESSPHWSGQCRGAQPPFPDDICADGDFDCDGKDQNSKTQDCSCKPGGVQCPTIPLVTVPYPPPTALPLKVDAASWFTSPPDVNQAKNWKWTLRGGDCDNILPHPTYSFYPTADGSGTPVGSQVDTLGISGKEHGMVAQSPTINSSFYPAFSLSGDYLLQGEFDLYGQHYSCLQKIQVRAPGIRAEACWDTEKDDVDLDLHMAKVDGFSSCANKGWSSTCTNQDCYYSTCSGGSSTDWYTASPSTACTGWGSQSTSTTCGNPRLDRDANGLSGTCDPLEINPNAAGSLSSGNFCGPENINVDAPTEGTKYAVAVRYYRGSVPSRTHVNVYCNGERVLSTGYNPINGNDFPKLATSGANSTGDMWKVAMITAHINNNVLNCDVAPTQSQQPHLATDGSNAYCVDNTATDTAQSATYLTTGGLTPLNADALCFH